MAGTPDDLPTEGGSLATPPSAVARALTGFGWLGVVVLLVPILLTCADILWRRLVGGAFMDTYDITKLCLVTVAALSIPYGFIHSSHVTVDLLVERMAPRRQGLLDAGIHLLAAVFFAVLLYLAWTAAVLHYSYNDTTQNLQIPIVYYFAVFLFGLALTVIACLWRVGQGWRRFRQAGPAAERTLS